MPFIMLVRNSTMNTIRNTFMMIDWAIYSFISVLLELIFDIADLPADTFQSIYDGIVSKVYLILAIFMLFKIIVTLLTYLVNPDVASDKQQGVGKIVTRIMITFILLIATPTLFGLMRDAQAPLLRTIPRIILSRNVYNNDSNTNEMTTDGKIAGTGTEISWSVMKAFYYKSPKCFPDEGYQVPDFVENPLQRDIIVDAAERVNEYCTGANDGSIYKYEYRPILSTIAGGFMCYCLIGIAIAIAIRMFKLVILQMIAPIPIISYIDPKTSKDGMFNSWVKTIITTWVELFINMAIIYIIIYVISEIIISDGSSFLQYVGSLDGILVRLFFMVFIILGLFAFARQAPKFIFEALGIKTKGSFGKIMGMSASLLGAPIATGRDFANRVKTEGCGSAFKNSGRSLLTGAGSAFIGAQAAYEGDKLSSSGEARRKYMENRLNYISSDTKKKQDMYDRIKDVNDTAFNVKKVGEEEAVKDNEYKTYGSYINAAMNGDQSAYAWLAEQTAYRDNYTSDVFDLNKVAAKDGELAGQLSQNDYAEFSSNLAAAQAGDQGALNWLKSQSYTSDCVSQQVDIAKASKWFENDFKDQKVNDLFASIGTGKNSRFEDAVAEHNKAIEDASRVRVDGEHVTFRTVDNTTRISGDKGDTSVPNFKRDNLGHSSSVASKLSRDTGVRGAKRRKK